MKIILHIGQPKTGTSSIQRFLYKNQNILESLGYYYYTYDENLKNKKLVAGVESGAFEFYNHSDILLKIFTEPLVVQKYIDMLIQMAQSKNLHTVIISSELLYGMFYQRQVETLIKMFHYPMTAIVYMKRPDLYIESLWQQWYFFDYNNFDEYLKKQSFPDYYEKLSLWNDNVNKLIVTPFEKRYFQEGLESHFLKSIGITDFKKFNFDYISDKDNWGSNKGLTPQAINIIMLNKDLLDQYDDRFLLHKFFNRNLNSLFEKKHSESHHFLTNEQRLTILKIYRPILQKVAIDFLGSTDEIFEKPASYSDVISTGVHTETIIRSFIHLGVKQDLAIQELMERVEILENKILNRYNTSDNHR